MASRGKKFLIGCGIGCGALILVAIVVMISFFAWISRPGELLEPENLLSSDTLGFVEWTLTLDDPGTRRFVEGLYDESQAQRAQGRTPLPPEIEKLLLGWQDKRNRESFEELFPVSVAWLLRAGEGPQEDRHLFGVSLKTAGNRLVFADWVLGLTLGLSGKREAQKIPYKGENIYLFDLPGKDPMVVFLRGNDLFFTHDLDTARNTVDRLVEPDSTRERSPVEDLLAGAPEAPPLRGALSNGRGEVFRSWEKLAIKVEDRDALREMTDALQGVTLSGDLSEDGMLLGRLELHCPDAEWASSHAEAALQAFQMGLDYPGLGLEAQARADGNRILIQFELGGFFTLLDDLSIEVD
jgi:hypothetical protein